MVPHGLYGDSGLWLQQWLVCQTCANGHVHIYPSLVAAAAAPPVLDRLTAAAAAATAAAAAAPTRAAQAIRGGGALYGIVTSWTFNLFPAPCKVGLADSLIHLLRSASLGHSIP